MSGPAQTVPPPERAGGWPRLLGSGEIRDRAGMDLERLAAVGRRQQVALCPGDSWALAVVRRGWLVHEAATFAVLATTRFDIWSATKALTALAFGALARERDADVLLATPVYDRVAPRPFSDGRKDRITLHHLLAMTSGIPGRAAGVVGMATEPDVGPFEHAIGLGPNADGRSAATLLGEPGTVWDYSDPAWAHLSLVHRALAGRELATALTDDVLGPIGVEGLSWDVQGGAGHRGPHTNAHTGVHVSARELARIGHLVLHGGRWAHREVVPVGWIERLTRPSQGLNPAWGLGFWLNTGGRLWPGVPEDAVAMIGYRSNRCWIVPSLDLVVVRIGGGPPSFDDRELIAGIVAAVVA